MEFSSETMTQLANLVCDCEINSQTIVIEKSNQTPGIISIAITFPQLDFFLAYKVQLISLNFLPVGYMRISKREFPKTKETEVDQIIQILKNDFEATGFQVQLT